MAPVAAAPFTLVRVHIHSVPTISPPISRGQRLLVCVILISIVGKSQQAKSDKDVQQAAMLLPVLLRKRPEDVKRVWEEARARGPAWRELLLAGATQLPSSVRDGLRALGLPIDGQG